MANTQQRYLPFFLLVCCISETDMDSPDASRSPAAERELLAALTHEIRSTLNGVVGMACLLRHTPLNAEQARYVQSLQHCSDTLMVLANDMLDYSKIEAGQLTLERVAFDVHDTIGATMLLLEHQAHAKGLQWQLQGLESLPRCATGDPTRLKQVLLNMLGNALKFTDHGQVELRCRATPTSGGWWLELAVADSGCGLTREQQEKLFHPYQQAHSAVARERGGTGLGLVISQRLCQAMGGGLLVSSQPGEGSVFTACMHLAHYQPSAVLPVCPTGKAGPPDGWRVLVVDDEIVNREYMSAWLGRQGLQVACAATGQAALDWIQREPFDLVLMDMHMPGLTGPETAALMRGVLAGRKSQPLIVGLSGTLDDDTRRLYLQQGADYLLPKPIDWHALWSWVAHQCAAPLRSDTRPTPPHTATV
jgi:two-component system, sensor histidine kinase